jgi:galactose mutarotase-like enzyme
LARGVDVDEAKLLHIASLIREGFQMGFHPYWNLEATHEVFSDESDMEYIADLVEEGFTSGYEPTWSIDIGED